MERCAAPRRYACDVAHHTSRITCPVGRGARFDPEVESSAEYSASDDGLTFGFRTSSRLAGGAEWQATPRILARMASLSRCRTSPMIRPNEQGSSLVPKLGLIFLLSCTLLRLRLLLSCPMLWRRFRNYASGAFKALPCVGMEFYVF